MSLALFNTFFRSFFLQTLWNYERMQNVGFAFGISPLLKQLKDPKPLYRQMLRHQLAFFNTHPYFAPMVMGVVYAREKMRPERQAEEDPTVTVLKNSMGGAFGAVGDHVIWGTWRPFCALTALAVGIWVAYPIRSWAVCAKWWMAGFLALFNAVHLWLRWRGMQRAVTEGPRVIQWLESLHLQAWAAQVRRIGLLLAAVMTLVYLARWSASNVLLWMMAVLLGTVVLKRWSVSGILIFYLVCAVSFLASLFGVRA